ncbi:MAG TPA: ArsA-related P-loop ATPase, partial [Thermoanaerobaculia bacterium]|nr:ArsA-related P-loop ATPase [Thermoanaerobaculia bacterium]
MSDERRSTLPGSSLTAHFSSLASRRVVLIGGKGGVGKTTIATAAALHFAESRETILFTTDPASNLADLFSRQPPAANRQLKIESLDAAALWGRFLEVNLPSFVEIGDRGTYLDREEIRRLFELSLPGVDELMAWMRIGELTEERPEAMLVVDTAPTGHTLRMLSSGAHFAQLAAALDAMQEKHRTIVAQLTRRDVRDAIDAFIADFDARAERRRALLSDPARAAFVPVALAEPLVVEQTLHLIDQIDIDVPLVVLNRARGEESDVRARFAPRRVVEAMRACVPLDSAARIREWSRAKTRRGGFLPTTARPSVPPFASRSLAIRAPMLFLAGKGGVGKTSCAASIALQLAMRDREKRFVAISVDPAHSLRDLFAAIEPPPNLAIETIDTKEKWRRFRESIGAEIGAALDALTPRGLTLAHDAEAMERLIEIAPPGADELFAITRLADLAADESLDGVIVDTAPTGHFLRLLELP